MTFKVDAIVIGAGVVGLACARALAMRGLETLVIEKESAYGQGISSRNSEVIHAGLYYRTGSLKARLCISGRELLYAYCDEHHVAHQQTGKLIVANGAEQIDKLHQIKAQARHNGCLEVDFIDMAKVRAMEPELRCDAALHSPRTGIIDSHGLMTELLGDVERHGGALVLKSSVIKAVKTADGYVLTVDGHEQTDITARYVVNSAGLDAPLLMAGASDFPREHVPATCFAKGSYFSLSGRSPFKRLIYPVPERGGLGVHLTLDLQGMARFGPDVEWISELGYQVDDAKRDTFAKAVQSYWPGCDAARLQPAYAGVRPKLGSPAQFSDDFCIQGPAVHGQAGWMNLFGIESPGLTSCLAIAGEVMNGLELSLN